MHPVMAQELSRVITQERIQTAERARLAKRIAGGRRARRSPLAAVFTMTWRVFAGPAPVEATKCA